MPDKPLADVWTDRDMPVLAAITRRIDSGERAVAAEVVAEELNMETDEVKLAMRALERRDLVTVTVQFSGGFTAVEVAGSAYLITGLHPDGDEAITRLISALTQAADQTADPEERSLIRRAVSGLAGLPASVAGGVMTAYATGLLPGQ